MSFDEEENIVCPFLHKAECEHGRWYCDYCNYPGTNWLLTKLRKLEDRINELEAKCSTK